MKFEKKNYLHIALIGLVVIFLIVLFFYFFLNYNFSQLMLNFVYDYFAIFGDWGVYLAVFLISIFGNFTVVFPVPYLIAVMTVIIVLPVNFWIIALAAGFGASIGELTAWIIGRAAKGFVKNDKSNFSKNMRLLKRWVDKGYAFILTVFFAFTPLPDDVLLIVLGSINYSLVKVLFATIIGKILMVIGLIFISEFTISSSIGQFILNLYGLNIVEGAFVASEHSLASNFFIVITIILLISVFKFDWSKFFKEKK